MTAIAVFGIATVGPAAAQEPPSCVPDWHPRLRAELPIDLGGGIVAQKQTRSGLVTGKEGDWGETGTVFHDCADGGALFLWTSRQTREGQTDYDKRSEADELLADLASDRSARSLAEIMELAGRDRIDRRRFGKVGIETCPCAALYPDLQGDKVPYEDVK